MSKNSRYARKCLTLLALTYNTYTAYQTKHLRCLYICCTVRSASLSTSCRACVWRNQRCLLEKVCNRCTPCWKHDCLSAHNLQVYTDLYIYGRRCCQLPHLPCPHLPNTYTIHHSALLHNQTFVLPCCPGMPSLGNLLDSPCAYTRS